MVKDAQTTKILFFSDMAKMKEEKRIHLSVMQVKVTLGQSLSLSLTHLTRFLLWGK